MAFLLRTITFSVFVLMVAGVSADEQTPKFKVKTRKMDDTVSAQTENGKVLFSVKSPSGIGSASIDRVEKDWPRTVALKFHLNGLENLVISNGKMKLNVAVSSADGKRQARLWKEDREAEPLDPKSPYWMDVRILGADGMPAQRLPLEGGHFEMTLPAAFLEGNPPSITVQWIDFYRG